MVFDGPCPFLTCTDTEWHAHPACPACGAVRYGNLNCPTCVRCNDMMSDDTRRILLVQLGELCCDLHGHNCEPPSELCCWECTEAAHDSFPIRHNDGTPCVLDQPLGLQ